MGLWFPFVSVSSRQLAIVVVLQGQLAVALQLGVDIQQSSIELATRLQLLASSGY